MKNNHPEEHFVNAGREIASWLLSAAFFFILFKLMESFF